MFPNFINGILAGPAPTIDRTSVNGMIVSTADSADEGPETAIIDENGTYPVERYTTKDLALEGHARWVKFCAEAKAGTEINRLGDSEGYVENEPRALQPMDPTSERYIVLSSRGPV